MNVRTLGKGIESRLSNVPSTNVSALLSIAQNAYGVACTINEGPKKTTLTCSITTIRLDYIFIWASFSVYQTTNSALSPLSSMKKKFFRSEMIMGRSSHGLMLLHLYFNTFFLQIFFCVKFTSLNIYKLPKFYNVWPFGLGVIAPC